MTAPELLERLRPEAFAIAYRMLGSVSDAEDLVQEGLLRLHRTLQSGETIETPQAYLATVVTRLSIDHLRSARVRRERYVGEWLPEPLLGAEEPDAEARVELAESARMAFLVLLETLSPEQRAVFLLRDVFGYSYADLAEMLGKSEAACRQIAVRARAHVLEGRPRFEAPPERQRDLVERFFAAIEKGDLAGLEGLLAEDVSLHGDGGGRAPALAEPQRGREAVARMLLGWSRVGARAGGYRIDRTTVNHQPGALIRSADGGVLAVWAIDVSEGRIVAVRSVVNPDKLRHVPGAADFGAWLRASAERGRGPSE